MAAREQDALKAGIAPKLAKAQADSVQEYKDGFKDTMDYLFLMRDALNEYKASIKRVDPTFNGDYYDHLISGESDTPALEDSDEAPPEVAEQEVAQPADPVQEATAAQTPIQPVDVPSFPPANP